MEEESSIVHIVTHSLSWTGHTETPPQHDWRTSVRPLLRTTVDLATK